MVNKILNNLFNKKIIIFKPSVLFWLTGFFCLIIWIYLSPLNWRHYDDYEPLNDFLSWLGAYNFSIEPNNFPTYLFDDLLNKIAGENSLLRLIFVSLWVNLGWGSLPPIWNSIYLSITTPFLIFGIDASRLVLIFLGFFTNLISACLLSSVITRIFFNLKKESNLKNIKNLSDFFSVTFITLNPEILLHSQTYMPYQLPIITTLLFINLTFPESKNEKDSVLYRKKIFKIPQLWSIYIIFSSLLLGYQSIILLTAFIVSFIQRNEQIFRNKEFIKYKINKLKKGLGKFKETNFKIKNINKIKFPNVKIFIFGILIFAFIAYIYRFLIIFKNNIDVGDWSMGENNIYYLKYQFLNIKNAPIRVYAVLTRIASLALYPFRDYQSIFGLLFLVLTIFSWKNLYKVSFNFRNINRFIINLILITLVLSFFGKFNLSPTRHNIFIFPIAWIPVIYQLIQYFISNGFKRNNIVINFLLVISILSYFSIGCIRSFNQINYTKKEKDELISLANEADLFPSGAGQYDFSLFWTHGSKEFNSVKNKFCRGPTIHKRFTKAFLFSHRESFNPSSIEQRNFLEWSTNGCISKETNLKVLKSVERKNSKSLEMDNRINTGGSNLYGYLVEIE